MRMILKWTLRGLLGLILVACLYIGNLFSDRPMLLNHFLAKELLTQLFESPEVMTSVGLFDDFNWLTQHNDKLSRQRRRGFIQACGYAQTTGRTGNL